MPEEKPNLLPDPPAMPDLTPFESTSISAGKVAARYAKVRYLQILQYLQQHGEGGCIFEIAAAIGCLDHQISGRFSALVADNLIMRTGQKREKPSTKCDCDVYVITLLGTAIVKAASNASSNALQTPVECSCDKECGGTYNRRIIDRHCPLHGDSTGQPMGRP